MTPTDEPPADEPLTDDELPALCRALGIPGLVDVHTHFMPDNVLRKVWAYFDAAGPLVGARSWPIAYRLPEEERLARLRAMGVRRFTSMLYPHRPGMAAWLNAWAADFAARTPDCVHTATFFPEPAAERYVAEALAAGAGIFKAHIQVGGYDPRDPLLAGVWGQLAEAGVPVVVHCGSGPTAGAHTGPGPFGEVLAAHPRLPAVLAHMGMPEYADFLDLAARHQPVRLDTTMVFTDFTEVTMPFPPGLLPEVESLGRDGKVVLGTDFPNIPHPYAHQVQALVRLGFGDDWLRTVLWEAPSTVLGTAGEHPAGATR